MKKRDTILCQTLALVSLALALAASEAWAIEGRDRSQTVPTLARLSFWVPPQRMKEFEAVYEAKVVPILKRHGLVGSSERGRATPDSVFSRLFEVKTPSEVEDRQKVLQGDSTWTVALRNLEVIFGTGRGDGLIPSDFSLYAAPAGPGKTMPAGPGKVVPAGPGTGHWRTYDATDGLVDGTVLSILQDQEGHLWFGADGQGICWFNGRTFIPFTKLKGPVSVPAILQDREGNLWFSVLGRGVMRYNGKSFTTFTTQEGLADDRVWSILQDQEENLWFGTSGGVSRYDGKAYATFTTKDGLVDNQVRSILQDREGNLWFGTSGGVSRYNGHVPSTGSGHSFTSFTTKDGLADNYVSSIIQDREGNLWFGTSGGVSRYDGKAPSTGPSTILRANAWQHFTTFTTKDGLVDNQVRSILQDREGYLWFGTSGGVSRYDGKAYTTFTTKDGLVYQSVWSILQDREGYLWFGTSGGVSRYDGKAPTTFTTKDGLVDNQVRSILQDREGNLWFGTSGGVSRYDGKAYTTFTTKDGLVDNQVRSILQDREGNLWFGNGGIGSHGGGVSRYDGKTWTTFTTKDGLADNYVSSIIQDREGNLWFGTYGGVSRYDGKKFIRFTKADGLGDNRVLTPLQDREGYLWFSTRGSVEVSRYDGRSFTSLKTGGGGGFSSLQDRDGNLWFGSWSKGVIRYDGKTVTAFTQEDGLASNVVEYVFQDRQGILWFSSGTGGVSRYDGKTFTTFTQEDGLASNRVWFILQDREGYLWFATLGGGVTRYLPAKPVPPPTFVDAVVAGQRYERISELAIPTTVKMTAFEFHGMSFKTRPEAMVYRYRLNGYDEGWKTTHARRVEYQDVPSGTYTFEVVAVDRDLVYSDKIATVRLTIHPPYGTIALAGGLGLALVALTIVSGYAIKRRRDLFQEMEKELQTAHDMQMSLMPKESPKIEGVDIAGRCIPANHVGGDFFQYFHLPEGRLTLVLADVTGHAMEAAIPAVLFNGILGSQMELGGSVEELYGRLNRSFCRSLIGRTLVCFVMGEVDLSTHALLVSDSGCPYPYHYRGSTGDVVELQVDAYPLGVRPDTDYPVIEIQLQSGDRVVFCSDGIAEAMNSAGEQFSYERTAEVIRHACSEGLSAEATIDRILSEVNAFRGDAPQADDMTCVVLKVENTV